MVVFIIPFRSSKTTSNWDVVCRNLSFTVSSILNQTDRNFKVIIVSNEDLQFLPDSKHIEVLTGDFPIPTTYDEMLFDIRTKIFEGMKYAEKYSPCYVLRVDADDLLNRSVVQKLNHSKKRGYYFYFGYDFSLVTKKLSIRPRFYMSCGTAHAIKLSKENFPTKSHTIDSEKWFNDIWNHQNIDKKYRKYFGNSISIYPGIPVLRLVNTGENIEFNHENNFSQVKEIISNVFLTRKINQSFIDKFSLPYEYLS